MEAEYEDESVMVADNVGFRINWKILSPSEMVPSRSPTVTLGWTRFSIREIKIILGRISVCIRY